MPTISPNQSSSEGCLPQDEGRVPAIIQRDSVDVNKQVLVIIIDQGHIRGTEEEGVRGRDPLVLSPRNRQFY